MATILQLSHKLVEKPKIVPVDGIELRHFEGPADVERWLELRRRAFSREKLGVGDWAAADFEREFLHKSWWRPDAMWFAETRSPLLPPTVVGTVTLARRGEGPAARPVVHWLAMSSSYRGRGIGRLLMANLEAAVWAEGGRQVWLETHAAWTKAARLYESLGYRPTEE